ncbi:putative zinc-type alcohol dehydrogenase-like protein yoga [Achaetomium macrosporum]|uniref:Zinc-type alcohol dehydrogenase-like protein yoga n=1 Tax=Achaetomium macrosporum TaxID=79813 RepID=A0AAN7C3L8_9PEZI|nr:putative zinc-type alcohol dehydrogenase-like protein yoga [Achaetomium macrosporum]
MAAAAPIIQKQWLVQGTDKGFDGLVYQDAPVPKVGDNDVLVKLRGASLNYRDLIIPRGEYPFPLRLPVVAGSDGAGEIVAVGSKVTKWKPGDKVVTLFNQGHQAGPVTVAASKTGLGGCIDGTLRQYGVFNENGVTRMPKNLDFVEAATLTCAALTSWNALYGLKRLRKGETVLVQGTGGVSLFALQFAKAAGAAVIATTSSMEKAEFLKKLGADHVINYRENPNWGEAARKLTPNGEGVEHVIEVGGEKTMTQSLQAIKMEGVITIIGFLGGPKPKESTMEALNHVCTIRGVYVGSREQLEEMVAEMEKHDIHPVVDKTVFTLDKAREAYDYMWAQKHFGKIGIKIE